MNFYLNTYQRFIILYILTYHISCSDISQTNDSVENHHTDSTKIITEHTSSRINIFDQLGKGDCCLRLETTKSTQCNTFCPCITPKSTWQGDEYFSILPFQNTKNFNAVIGIFHHYGIPLIFGQRKNIRAISNINSDKVQSNIITIAPGYPSYYRKSSDIDRIRAGGYYYYLDFLSYRIQNDTPTARFKTSRIKISSEFRADDYMSACLIKFNNYKGHIEVEIIDSFETLENRKHIAVRYPTFYSRDLSVYSRKIGLVKNAAEPISEICETQSSLSLIQYTQFNPGSVTVYEPAISVIRDLASWERLRDATISYPNYLHQRGLPKNYDVDFSKEMIIVRSNGYSSVEITDTIVEEFDFSDKILSLTLFLSYHFNESRIQRFQSSAFITPHAKELEIRLINIPELVDPSFVTTDVTVTNLDTIVSDYNEEENRKD